ncbi:MAG TPA: SRPBCC family protein [Thermoanaerobaculia bacterium]|nr:SRPBCC family protein [Thermoanaerobaculia bacterium]
MIRFERTTFIAAPLAEVFAFFATHENLARITPPAMRFRIIESPGAKLFEGARIRYSMRIAGLPVRWTTRITLWRENEAFADLQERGPYRYWLHTHTFRAVPGGVSMHDQVDYDLPLGPLGRFVAGRFVKRQLEAIFDYRAEVIQKQFS